MKNTFLKIFSLGLIALSTSCGTNQDNIELLNSTNLPVLNSFASSPAYGLGDFYSSTTPYWLFSTAGFGNLLAPARGIVGEIGSSTIPNLTGTSFVTIIHSGRMATRIHGLQTVSVRSGDAVLSGANLGSFFSASSTAFQVFLDGASVCPLSYVTSVISANIFNLPCR
jgi:hypothetical protein